MDDQLLTIITKNLKSDGIPKSQEQIKEDLHNNNNIDATEVELLRSLISGLVQKRLEASFGDPVIFKISERPVWRSVKIIFIGLIMCLVLFIVIKITDTDSDCAIILDRINTALLVSEAIKDAECGHHCGECAGEKHFLKMSTEQSVHKEDAQAKLCREIIRCVNYAAIKHRDVRSKDEHQSPFINHLIAVAYILVNEGGISDVSVLQAALLHSTIEDTDTSYYELHAEFGEDIANLVKELTIVRTLPKPDKRQQKLEYAASASYRAKLVLLAKELNIMRDNHRISLGGWPKEKEKEYFEFATQLVTRLRGTNGAIEASLAELLLERGITIN